VIAVDTDVLVRVFVADEPSQVTKARRVFDDAAEGGARVWIGDTVLVELAWTLSPAYGHDRRDIATALRALASHATVLLESPAAVRSATEAFVQGPGDFAGCLLAMKAAAAGCDRLATFDRGMKALPGVQLL
jgi:predicted nucleic-acid-binding protein